MYIPNEVIFRNKPEINRSTYRISEDRICKVRNFYLRDDISWQSPHRKDVQHFSANVGNREILGKRYMIMSIKESYDIFKKEYTNVDIGLTKFYEYRPKNVLLSSETPHNMCLCKYHSNFNFLISSAAKILEKFPNNIKEFLLNTCCDLANEDCMTDLCEKCEKDLFYAFVPVVFNLDITTSWKLWKEVDGRVLLVLEEGTLEDLLYKIEEKLQSFKFHYYVKWAQENYFRQKKEIISDDELILQIDFAENYALISQDEIQAAHWNHPQVTIFTCAAWLKAKFISLVVISDELTHGKYETAIFLENIICFLKKEFNFSKISIHSDGCAGQFKNKYTLSNICNMMDDFNINNVEWSFFATSHGKGAVDGIGAAVKRKVWGEVRSRNVILNTAADFFSCASTIIEGVEILFVSKNEITNLSEKYRSRWEKVKPLKGIQKYHYFRAVDKNSVLFATTAKSALNLHNL